MSEYLAVSATARCASKLATVNKNAASLYFQRFREIIAHELEQESLEVFEGEIEVDERYFLWSSKENVGKDHLGK